MKVKMTIELVIYGRTDSDRCDHNIYNPFKIYFNFIVIEIFMDDLNHNMLVSQLTPQCRSYRLSVQRTKLSSTSTSILSHHIHLQCNLCSAHLKGWNQ